MNHAAHSAQLEKLGKILDMINLCERYLISDNKTLNSEACNWLSSLRNNTKARIELRTKAVTRLRVYYAKNAFLLASMAYNETNTLKVTFKQTTEDTFIGGNHVSQQTIDDLQQVNL